MASAVDRVRRALARQGPAAVVRIAADRLRRAVGWREDHVWYEMEFAGRPENPEPLPDPWHLERAVGDQLERVEELGRSGLTAREFLRRGHDLWLAVDATGKPAFGCWIHRGEAPLIAAPGGWIGLPDGVVCLEDSVTAEHARGNGIAPRSWSLLAASLAAEGLHSMITKVLVENTAADRAVTKAGFRRIGVMHARSRFGRVAITMTVEQADSPTAQALRRTLEA